MLLIIQSNGTYLYLYKLVREGLIFKVKTGEKSEKPQRNMQKFQYLKKKLLIILSIKNYWLFYGN